MPQLKASRFVEPHDLAVQRNVQFSRRDGDLNEIRMCSFVCYRFANRVRFHVNAPIPHTHSGFAANCVSKAWSREKLSTAPAGSGGNSLINPRKLSPPSSFEFLKFQCGAIRGRAGKSLFARDCVVGPGGLELLTKRLSAPSSEH
jgi:hypothetical protein